VITEEGIYDIPEDEYHTDPVAAISLSSSLGKLFIEATPKHVWMAHPRLNPNFEPDLRQTFDLGHAAHALLLGDDRKFEIIAAPDYRTKDAQQKRDAARAAHKIPILEDQWHEANAMVRAARAQIIRLEEDADAFSNGKPEQTLVWRETVNGNDVWCRARLDWLHDKPGNVYHDFKSTGASAAADQWGKKSLFDLGFDFQDAFYCRGIRKLLGVENPHFRFVVQENYAPFCLAVHELAPMARAAAALKVEEAISYWAWCRAHNAWPGYSKRVHYIDAPPWRIAEIEARMDRRSIETTDEQLRASIEWMQP